MFTLHGTDDDDNDDIIWGNVYNMPTLLRSWEDGERERGERRQTERERKRMQCDLSPTLILLISLSPPPLCCIQVFPSHTPTLNSILQYQHSAYQPPPLTLFSFVSSQIPLPFPWGLSGDSTPQSSKTHVGTAAWARPLSAQPVNIFFDVGQKGKSDGISGKLLRTWNSDCETGRE